MDAEKLFYITLILGAPIFFVLGRKIVALIFSLFGLTDLKITAVFENGEEKKITINLESKEELDQLIKEIHSEQEIKRLINEGMK